MTGLADGTLSQGASRSRAVRLPIVDSVPTESDETEQLRISRALAQLPDALRELNANYLAAVSARALAHAHDIHGWFGSHVHVFLRHDRVQVFAIACDDQVGMANSLALDHAQFHVDPCGREQTLQELGPLPNQRTIHAWVSGRLLWAGDEGGCPDPKTWHAVLYNPRTMDSFRLADSVTEVRSSRQVLFVPGRLKVWCRGVGKEHSEGSVP